MFSISFCFPSCWSTVYCREWCESYQEAWSRCDRCSSWQRSPWPRPCSCSWSVCSRTSSENLLIYKCNILSWVGIPFCTAVLSEYHHHDHSYYDHSSRPPASSSSPCWRRGGIRWRLPGSPLVWPQTRWCLPASVDGGRSCVPSSRLSWSGIANQSQNGVQLNVCEKVWTLLTVMWVFPSSRNAGSLERQGMLVEVSKQ